MIKRNEQHKGPLVYVLEGEMFFASWKMECQLPARALYLEIKSDNMCMYTSTMFCGA